MCVLTQMNTTHPNQSGTHERTVEATWFHAFNTQTCTHFSDHRSRLLPSPTTHAMSVCFLSSLSCCVVVLPLWQAHWNWQHDLYSRTNMPGNISSHDMAGETPGTACDCVSYTFRLNCRVTHSGWAATSSTAHSRALCLQWLSFYTFEKGSWYLNTIFLKMFFK